MSAINASPRTRPLRELARLIRSKNAKPYRLTLDVLFDDPAIYERVKSGGALNPAAVARAYKIPESWITSWHVFDPGLAFKFTLVRARVQGVVGDGDVYGAQQHGPLLDIPIPWNG